MKAEGVVKWFDAAKGYGFILNEQGIDVFVQYRAILMEGYKILRGGDNVRYFEVKSAKGLSAAEVELL